MKPVILQTLVALVRSFGGDKDSPQPGDADLLARFTHERDAAAFATILERHARLVWGVCRGLLPNDADAEDAFQATWVALFRGAGRIRQTRSLAPWLHGTATRVAKKVRLAADRRHRRERRAARPEAAPVAGSDETWAALHLAVNEEITHLPAILRTAFVLCVLEGHRHEDAAAKLGVPVGTLSARVSRARKKLLERLTARGLTPAAAATAAALGAGTVPAAVTEGLLRLVRGHLADGFTSVPEAVLNLATVATGGAAMKGRLLLAAMLIGGSLALGAGGVWFANAQDKGATPSPGPGAARGAIEMTFEFHGKVPASELKVELSVPGGLTRDQRGLILPLRITNAAAVEIKTTLAHEWHGGEWPPTSLFASATPDKVKEVRPFTPVYLAGEDPGLPRAVTLAAGKVIDVELRMDWPGTGSVKGSPLITAPGKYDVRFALVFEAAGKKGFVVTDPVVIEHKLAQADEVDPFPGPDLVKRLREQLKAGTPRQKEAALNAIRELKSLRLIPEVIEAIEDPTPLPRDKDTGWGFVGHQAATVLGEIARDLDGVQVDPVGRRRNDFSFHDDQYKGGQELKQLGRLSEVRKNWARWWDDHRR